MENKDFGVMPSDKRYPEINELATMIAAATNPHMVGVKQYPAPGDEEGMTSFTNDLPGPETSAVISVLKSSQAKLIR